MTSNERAAAFKEAVDKIEEILNELQIKAQINLKTAHCTQSGVEWEYSEWCDHADCQAKREAKIAEQKARKGQPKALPSFV